jgi:hypothetical protein
LVKNGGKNSEEIECFMTNKIFLKISIMFILLFLSSSFSFGKNSTIKLLKPIYYEILKFVVLYGEDKNSASATSGIYQKTPK